MLPNVQPIYLAPAGSHQEVRIDVLLAELLGDVEAEGTVVVIDVAFRQIAEDAVRSVHLLELQYTGTQTHISTHSLYV